MDKIHGLQVRENRNSANGGAAPVNDAFFGERHFVRYLENKKPASFPIRAGSFEGAIRLAQSRWADV